MGVESHFGGGDIPKFVAQLQLGVLCKNILKNTSFKYKIPIEKYTHRALKILSISQSEHMNTHVIAPMSRN